MSNSDDEFVQMSIDSYSTYDDDGHFGRDIPTKGGEFVRSRLEQYVADWLHDNGYNYEYEPCYSGPYVPDFVVGDVVIEVWGMTGNTKYDLKRQEKERWYSEQGVNLIGIEPENVDTLDNKLQKLNKVMES